MPETPHAEPPLRDIHPFFKVGPLMLVLGSLSASAMMMTLAQALEWSDPGRGFAVSLFFTFTFGLPVLMVLFVIQAILALLFMTRRRRAWWRSGIVLLPAALLTFAALASITSLYPPERRARNELQRFLGGPLPASARDFTLHYEGGIDPTRRFEFSLSSSDYAAIRRYRSRRRKGAKVLSLAFMGQAYGRRESVPRAGAIVSSKTASNPAGIRCRAARARSTADRGPE
jgi:hypothetical protein